MLVAETAPKNKTNEPRNSFKKPLTVAPKRVFSSLSSTLSIVEKVPRIAFGFCDNVIQLTLSKFCSMISIPFSFFEKLSQ